MMLINSTFAFPYFRVMSNNVVYDICYDWNKKVRYICVHEGQVDKFATSEGISIGMSYSDVAKKIGKRKLKEERFVGYYMELPSGWYIAFYLGKTGIERAPKKDDAVCKIFKI